MDRKTAGHSEAGKPLETGLWELQPGAGQPGSTRATPDPGIRHPPWDEPRPGRGGPKLGGTMAGQDRAVGSRRLVLQQHHWGRS